MSQSPVRRFQKPELPEILVEASLIARERGLTRPLLMSEIEDIARTTGRLPFPGAIARCYPELSQTQALKQFQADLAEGMGLKTAAVDGRSLISKRGPRRQNWSPESMLAGALIVVREEGLTTLPTARAMGTYAREGRAAGINIVERRYISESGTGLRALQTDIAQAMGWPPPVRSVGHEL